MKIKRILALILALLMCVTVFAGCEDGNEKPNSNTSGNVSADDPLLGEDNITLKVWAPTDAVDVFKKLCDNFIAKYPNKTISIEVIPQSESNATTNLNTDPEESADVFGIASDQLNVCVNNDLILPVYDGAVESVKSENSEGAVKAATINDILYAYPETGDNGYYLVYDKRVISDEQAKTMEGIFEACKAANKKFIINSGDGYYACMFAFTGGLTVQGINENNKQIFNDFDRDQVVASMEAFAKLFHDYSEYYADVEVAKISSGLAIDQPLIAGGIDGSWNAKAAQEALGENFGAAKLPTIKVNGEDKQIISMHGYKLICVNKKTKFQVTSQLLAQYLAGEEAQQYRAEQLSWGPSNKKVAESDVIKNNAAISAVLEQAEYSVPQVNIVKGFWDPFKVLGKKLYSEKDPYDKETLGKLLDTTIQTITTG